MRRRAITVAIFLAGLCQVSRVEADFHLMQIDEVMAGLRGDANVQFIEMKMSAQGQNCQGTGNHPLPGNTADRLCDVAGPGARLVFFDASGLPTNEFIFPENTPNFEAGRSILIATQRFADLDTTSQPDFIMPAFVPPGSGKICYMNRPNAPFSINLCLAYGTFTGAPESAGIAPALPITGNSSLKRVNNTFHNATDFALDTPAPCNNAGVCGTPSTSNTPPVANLQSVITAEDTAVIITLTGSDPEGDPLTFTIVSPPTHGVLSGAAPHLTYTPHVDFNGSDSFTFTVHDGRLASDVARVSMTVTAVNDTPIANLQSVSTAKGTAVTITLTGSDPEGTPLDFTIVTPPAHGTLRAITGTSCTAGTCTATVTFTSHANFAGADHFAFMVHERSLPSAQAALIAQGEHIFFTETFAGNGRTCGTCHPAENNFTIDPAFIATLPPDDPLFVAEFNPDLAALENPRLLRDFGLILENVDGFNRPGVMRSVPHILALSTSVMSPTGPRTGWGGDGAPDDGSLRSFATGAVIQHFTKTLQRVPGRDFRLPTPAELDALEAFQLSLGRQADLSLPLPLKGDMASRGQEIFLDNARGKCDLCHVNAGAIANLGGGSLGNANFDTGVEALPNQPADLTGEPNPPDEGLGRDPRAQGGFGDGTFNVTSLVEAADTGPFFHNNASATLEEAVAFYNSSAFNDSPAAQGLGGDINLTATQVLEVAAFLRVINALENIRSAIHGLQQTTLIHRASGEIEDAQSVLQGGGLHPDAVTLLKEAQSLIGQQRIPEAVKKAKEARVFLMDNGNLDSDIATVSIAVTAPPPPPAAEVVTAPPPPSAAEVVTAPPPPPVAEVVTAPPPPSVADGGGCFIATAAYGSPWHPYVDILRAFRDQYLLTNSVGAKFVRWYATYSPPMAEYVREHPLARQGIRLALIPLIGLAALLLQTTGVEKVVLAVLILCISVSYGHRRTIVYHARKLYPARR